MLSNRMDKNTLIKTLNDTKTPFEPRWNLLLRVLNLKPTDDFFSEIKGVDDIILEIKDGHLLILAYYQSEFSSCSLENQFKLFSKILKFAVLNLEEDHQFQTEAKNNFNKDTWAIFRQYLHPNTNFYKMPYKTNAEIEKIYEYINSNHRGLEKITFFSNKKIEIFSLYLTFVFHHSLLSNAYFTLLKTHKESNSNRDQVLNSCKAIVQRYFELIKQKILIDTPLNSNDPVLEMVYPVSNKSKDNVVRTNELLEKEITMVLTPNNYLIPAEENYRPNSYPFLQDSLTHRSILDPVSSLKIQSNDQTDGLRAPENFNLNYSGSPYSIDMSNIVPLQSFIYQPYSYTYFSQPPYSQPPYSQPPYSQPPYSQPPAYFTPSFIPQDGLKTSTHWNLAPSPMIPTVHRVSEHSSPYEEFNLNSSFPTSRISTSSSAPPSTQPSITTTPKLSSYSQTSINSNRTSLVPQSLFNSYYPSSPILSPLHSTIEGLEKNYFSSFSNSKTSSEENQVTTNKKQSNPEKISRENLNKLLACSNHDEHDISLILSFFDNQDNSFNDRYDALCKLFSLQVKKTSQLFLKINDLQLLVKLYYDVTKRNSYSFNGFKSEHNYFLLAEKIMLRVKISDISQLQINDEVYNKLINEIVQTRSSLKRSSGCSNLFLDFICSCPKQTLFELLNHYEGNRELEFKAQANTGTKSTMPVQTITTNEVINGILKLNNTMFLKFLPFITNQTRLRTLYIKNVNNRYIAQSNLKAIAFWYMELIQESLCKKFLHPMAEDLNLKLPGIETYSSIPSNSSVNYSNKRKLDTVIEILDPKVEILPAPPVFKKTRPEMVSVKTSSFFSKDPEPKNKIDLTVDEGADKSLDPTFEENDFTEKLLALLDGGEDLNSGNFLDEDYLNGGGKFAF